MKRLNGADVLKLWRIAKRDKRLGRDDRVLLADIARTGHAPSAKNAAAAKRAAKLRELGYLP